MHLKHPPAKLPLTTNLHIFHALCVQKICTQLLALHRLVTKQLLRLYLLECVIIPPYELFDAKPRQFQLVEVQDSCPMVLIYTLAMPLTMTIDLLLYKVSL